ncbi:P-II family nitrogen regulator [Candidatus Dependentiae bacterium]
MDFYREKLLTVITESEIEENLIEDISKLGAKGYTIYSVRGKGEKGIRNAIWSSNSNIKIEIVCCPKVCEKIIEFLKENYLKNYAMILFVADVNVLRSRKF